MTMTDSAQQRQVASGDHAGVAGLTILFGSQTGNAEFLAHQIRDKAVAAGDDAIVSSLEEWLHGDRSLARLLVVTATHDMGHMPDNAAEFWDWINELAPGSLDGLPYAVLSIGDSMYDDFCKAGHDIDERLLELGARRVVDGIDCDTDFEYSAPKWAAATVGKLFEEPAWDSSNDLASTDEGSPAEEPAPRAEPVRLARVVEARPLSRTGSAKHVVHYELDFDDGAFEYQPGDSVAIAPTNAPELVDEWLQAFDADADSAVAEQLRTGVELRLPHPGLLAALARLKPDNAKVAELVESLESGDRGRVDAWLWGRDVLDVVRDLDCLDVTLETLLGELRPIQRRDYSISSSPTADEGRLHITVSEVQYDRDGRKHRGTGSSHLADAAASGAPVEVRRLPAHDFKLPAVDAPVIMIGPGVGVAPFRSFLRQRNAVGAVGRNWLFFGDQHREFDWLYEDEFDELAARDVLHRLNAAFSRDQHAKHYVQHEMLANADEFRRWLADGAYVFVCGDKSTMAPDVDRAMLEILAGNADGRDPKDALAELRSAGRYVKDVY